MEVQFDTHTDLFCNTYETLACKQIETSIHFGVNDLSQFGSYELN
jgi:hypothetical protein